MNFRIGFLANNREITEKEKNVTETKPVTPKKSLVRVFFEKRHLTCTYYNDLFDLHVGDIVYVEGKLEGLVGRVVEVNYNFKIKLSDYKRVTGLADTEVHGTFFRCDNYFLTFDGSALPYQKVKSWFGAPPTADDDIVSCGEGCSFRLEDDAIFKNNYSVMANGKDYFDQDRVLYVSVDNGKGYAIVVGTNHYTVEFDISNGEISNLFCDCYCVGECKHEYATVLLLRKLFERIDEDYSEKFNASKSFTAVLSNILFGYALGNKKNVTLTL